MSKEMFTPFSNGTEAMQWYDENCGSCTKAFFPKKDGDYPSDKTMKQYCSTGKECKMKYAMDVAFITGEMPLNMAQQIGLGKVHGLKETCIMWSDNDDDGYKPPSRPKPDNTPANQMCLPYEINEILEGHQVQTRQLEGLVSK